MGHFCYLNGYIDFQATYFTTFFSRLIASPLFILLPGAEISTKTVSFGDNSSSRNFFPPLLKTQEINHIY
jgi:hypothetical protein